MRIGVKPTTLGLLVQTLPSTTQLETRGSNAIKLGSWDKHPAYSQNLNVKAVKRLLNDKAGEFGAWKILKDVFSALSWANSKKIRSAFSQ